MMTYFYPIYFAILLIHRAWRDDEFCKEKYGDGWKEYKKRVPYVSRLMKGRYRIFLVKLLIYLLEHHIPPICFHSRN